MIDDLRVCVVGDSLVAGVGDPEHLGWSGRLAARTERAGQPLTTYTLGVRRETGDGAHPGPEGYRRNADLVRPTWARWLGLEG